MFKKLFISIKLLYMCGKVDIIVNNVIGNTQDIEMNVFNFNFSKSIFSINNCYNRKMMRVKLYQWWWIYSELFLIVFVVQRV